MDFNTKRFHSQNKFLFKISKSELQIRKSGLKYVMSKQFSTKTMFKSQKIFWFTNIKDKNFVKINWVHKIFVVKKSGLENRGCLPDN